MAEQQINTKITKMMEGKNDNPNKINFTQTALYVQSQISTDACKYFQSCIDVSK